MASGRLVIPSWMPALDSDGIPIPNASIYFYVNRTTTLATIYSDEALSVPMPNPVFADSSGQFPPVWQSDDLLFSASVDAPFGPPGQPFTFDDLAPSSSIGGSANKLDRDGGNYEPTLLPNIGAVAIDGSSFSPPSAVTPTDSLQFRRATNDFRIFVEDYGAVANDPTVDNTAAINAAEAAAALAKADVVFQASGVYYFKGTLRAARNRCVWRGDRTDLIYNGASTTIDLLVIGNESTITGSTPSYYVENSFSGLSINSLTLMTGGWAIRAPGLCRSTLAFDNIGSQDFIEARRLANAGYVGTNVVTGAPEQTGRTLYNGVWFQFVDNVAWAGEGCNTINTPWAVNGRSIAAGGGPKADLWILVRKIGGYRSPGIMGGGFGGLYFSPMTTFIGGEGSVLINESLTSEGNRELVDTGAIHDEARGLIGGANIIIDEPGTAGRSVQYVKAGGWVAACYGGHGIWVKQHKGKIKLNCIIRGNGKDGIRVDDPLSVVSGDIFAYDNGLRATDSGAANQTWYGINPNVASNSVVVSPSLTFGNYRKAGGTVFQDTGLNRTYVSAGYAEANNTRFNIANLVQRATFGTDGFIGTSPVDGNLGMFFKVAGGATGVFYDPGTLSQTFLVPGTGIPAFRIFDGGLVVGDAITIKYGSGSPEGVVQGNPGSLYSRTDTGQLYVKQGVGTGNTGWVAK